MKQALLWPIRVPWLAVIHFTVCAAGCATGSWLESPSEAELPLHSPKHSYPTAVRASLSDDSDDEPLDLQVVPPPASSAKSAATSQRLDKPAPPVPNLAVLPPQYVQRPQQPAVTPAETLQPPAPLAQPAPIPAAQPPQTSLSPHEIALAAAARSTTTPTAPPAALAPVVPAGLTPISPAPLLPVGPAHVAPAVITPATADEKSEPLPPIDEMRRRFIAGLEAEIRQRKASDAKDEELPRLEQELRLAYLAGGQFDEAVAEVESLDQAQREAYKHLMFSLGVWLSPEESRRSPLRSAKVLRSLRDAAIELASASKLEVRNLAFCTDVDAFGWYREFPRYEFQPKQPVVLYAEVDNFAAEKKSPSAFETELQGRYQIYDSTGRIVAERQLELDKSICRNYRRDYFVRYIIYMPDDIDPGRYRLELIIEDLKAQDKYPGRKQGEGQIEFTIRR